MASANKPKEQPDFFETELILQLVSDDDVELNLLDIDDRNSNIEYILSRLFKRHHSVHTHKSLEGIENKTAFSILLYDFIYHERELCFALTKTVNQIQKTSQTSARFGISCSNLFGIISILTQNPAVVKYIFQSNRCKINNSFLDALFCVVRDFRRWNNWNSKALFNIFTILLQCIRYWQPEHFIFAFEHIYNVSSLIIHFHWRLVSIKLNIDGQAVNQYFSEGLYREIERYTKKFDRKKKCELQIHDTFHRLLKKEFDRNVCGYSYNRFISDMNEMRNPPFIKKASMPCGWFLCHKQTNKCKKCKLIAYCCINHQKKNWELIHSQQCIRIYG
eukprot:225981_1